MRCYIMCYGEGITSCIAYLEHRVMLCASKFSPCLVGIWNVKLFSIIVENIRVCNFSFFLTIQTTTRYYSSPSSERHFPYWQFLLLNNAGPLQEKVPWHWQFDNHGTLAFFRSSCFFSRQLRLFQQLWLKWSLFQSGWKGPPTESFHRFSSLHSFMISPLSL